MCQGINYCIKSADSNRLNASERGKQKWEQKREERRERSVCLTLSLPCSMTALLNTAKRFKLRCLTTKGALRNDLYFTSRFERLYRSPSLPDPSLFSIVPTLAKFDFFFPLLYMPRYTGNGRFFIWLIAGTLLLWLRVTVAVTAVKRLGLQQIKLQVMVWVLTCSISH